MTELACFHSLRTRSGCCPSWTVAACARATRLLPLFTCLSLTAPAPASECSAWDSGVRLAELADPAVDEASGLGASQINPGILWTHNDSGSAAVLYALSLDGSIVESFNISGATNIDFEDLALGPCPEACACVFVADIGDNLAVRPVKTLYRVPEPELGVDADQTAAATALNFSYPGGVRPDAETLFIDPQSGLPYVVTKDTEGGISQVFRFPSANPSATVTLEPVATLDLRALGATNTLVTAGDITRDGQRIVLRTLQEALEFVVPTNGTISDAFTLAPRVIPLPATSQGEALAYAPHGMSLYSVSENLPAPLHEVSCLAGSPVTAAPPAFETPCAESSSCSYRPGGPHALPTGLWIWLGLGILSAGRRTRRQ